MHEQSNVTAVNVTKLRSIKKKINEISAIITLKKDVLDPQGKVIQQALDGMGSTILMKLDKESILKSVKENDPKKAKEIVENMCATNLVIENYKIIETQ